jgi:hypothetical protein
MPHPPSAYDLHQRKRWQRHDAHLWIRHDAARFFPPGTDPADVFPELKRQREAAEDATFAAQIAASRRFLAELRAEVDEMKALEPETKTGNFVVDHQIPNALNEAGRAQRLYPQCVSCGVSQGGRVGSLKGLR